MEEPSFPIRLLGENPYRYAGYQYDNETGLYYLIARYYHPEHGVLLSLDPDPGDADDILTQNGYTYANNNPVMLVDPDGHFMWMAINAGFAVYEGYKAYKTGRGWKYVAKKAALGAIGGGKLKLVRHTGKSLKFVWLLGKNDKKHRTRINTDLPGGKAVAKSIFRHLTKGKKVIQKRDGNSVRRYTPDNKYQIRYKKRKDGIWKINLDLKRGGVYEDIHF